MIRQKQKASRVEAFTLVELIICIAVTLVLLVALGGAGIGLVDRIASTQCQSNLRAIGSAAMLYAADHNQRLPLAKDWTSTDPDGGLQARWMGRLGPYLFPEQRLTPQDNPTAGVTRCPKGNAYELYGKSFIARAAAWRGTDYTPVVAQNRYVYLHSVHTDVSPLFIEANNYNGNLFTSGNEGHFRNLLLETTLQRHSKGQKGINVLYASGRVSYVTNPTVESLAIRWRDD